MKSFVSFFKTTFIGGLFFIVPVFLMIFLFEKITRAFVKIVDPISDKIDISFLGREMISRILSIILLLILCFIAGVCSKTKKAISFKNWIENSILSNIPGYTLIKGMTETAAGLDTNSLKDVVLVNMEEVWQIGFLMDRIDDDLNAVYVPGAPNPMAGDVLFVKWDRLKLLDVEGVKVMKLYRKLGVDSKIMIDGKFDKSIFDKK